MKNIVKYSLLVAFFALTLHMTTGCAHKRTPKQKFQIVSVDGVRGSIGKGWQIALTIANNTASNIHLVDGGADIYYKERKVAHIALEDGGVVIPRRQCSQVVVPLRITLSSNPLGALALLNNIRSGKFDDITVDYAITLSAFASHRSLSQKGVALADLARKFNYKLKN